MLKWNDWYNDGKSVLCITWKSIRNKKLRFQQVAMLTILRILFWIVNESVAPVMHHTFVFHGSVIVSLLNSNACSTNFIGMIMTIITFILFVPDFEFYDSINKIELETVQIYGEQIHRWFHIVVNTHQNHSLRIDTNMGINIRYVHV